VLDIVLNHAGGYRVDTVKDMDVGAARFFVSAIHEFAQSIGKERLSLKAEITGGRTRRSFYGLTLQPGGSKRRHCPY
jgi:hypothetical protein